MSDDPILTLEPLIEAIQRGVEASGWELSGLQKTTSHQFEGRWEGESTRSAYLFFHAPDGPDWVSVDVYLDETTRGLTGNLALVVDLLPLGRLPHAADLLPALASASRRCLPDRYRRPLTLRYRMGDTGDRTELSETEVRFKIGLPRRILEGGTSSVVNFSREVIGGFGRVLESAELLGHAAEDAEVDEDH